MRFSKLLQCRTGSACLLILTSLQEAAEEYELRLLKLFQAGTCECLEGIHPDLHAAGKSPK